MSDNEDALAVQVERPKRTAEQVTLAQMLKVLDKDVAAGVEKRLKKLSKKKGLKPMVNEQEVEKINRKAAYEEIVEDVSKWDPIVERNRGVNLSFPLDAQPDYLPTTAESLSNIKPRNELESEVQQLIEKTIVERAEEREKKKAEERYQKAISAEEAKDRHLEMQKARVRLNDFAAKMRRQKKIKSKSYHRLLKQERIKKHMRNVETNKDALMDEIERLQKIRAKERASLKHKNTGKWAKHAKFRAKYDEEARRQMLEQIGLASKFLEKPVMLESDTDEDDDDDISVESENDNANNSENDSSADECSVTVITAPQPVDTSAKSRKVTSEDPPSESVSLKGHVGAEEESGLNDDDDAPDGAEAIEEEQRKLMSEAFAEDDVVGEFRKAKDQIADEEQPKDVDTFLPGWGDWAGPGIEINEKKRAKFIKKAPKIDRKDKSLSNVIISEHANNSIKDMQPKQLPRGIRNDDHLRKVLSKPIIPTFTDQISFREATQPKISTRMGARIEPINRRVLTGVGKKASWA